MMWNAAASALPAKSPALAEIKWLKKQADDLAALRNDPGHSPITFGSDLEGRAFVKPNVFTSKDQAIGRLLEKPVEAYWKKLTGDLFALTQFAEFVSLAVDAERPLPRRPRLLSIPESRQPDRQRHRARGRQRSQPRSSRA
jgi:hypothetical protein